MRDTLLAAGGALLVAVLNEARAQVRARAAARDRRDALIAAVLELSRRPPAGSDRTGR